MEGDTTQKSGNVNKEQHKKQENPAVVIVPYEQQYSKAFKELNEEWIVKHFKMEPEDFKALNNPQEYILNGGGLILIALYNEAPVGVCALIKMLDPDYDVELAKMAVSPTMQGKNIGWLLGQAIVKRAQEMGSKNIYLESNTKLIPAINLYRKLGFKEVAGRNSPYSRANIQMVLELL